MRTTLFLLIASMAVFRAESRELVVETVTGKGKNDGADSGVYLRINDLQTRYPLDTPNRNDRQVGAEDIYPGIPLEIDPEAIQTIFIEIDGGDAWLLKSIRLKVVCGDLSTEELVFNKRAWLSTAKETVHVKNDQFPDRWKTRPSLSLPSPLQF